LVPRKQPDAVRLAREQAGAVQSASSARILAYQSRALAVKDPSEEPPPVRIPIGFRLIGIYKLVTAVLSLALGFGLFRLFQADVRAGLEPIIRSLRLDPENQLIHWLISRLAGLDRKQLHLIEAGTIGYAILHVIEGVGILRGRRWGGFLIILATSSLIPVECYELVQRLSAPRIAALVVNAGIVVYLIVNRNRLLGGRRSHRV
jgi:uncharacterized membrane protein (DUF2068 family)